MADQAEILNLAVRLESRRQGDAASLLAAALQEFRRQHAARVFLEVRQSNAGAIAFYSENGFVINSRRKGYYRKIGHRQKYTEVKISAINA